MSDNLSPIEIRFTSEFNRKFKALKKRYRNILHPYHLMNPSCWNIQG
jgi:mRNA-degrading endonuclease RelE of RelBE toxin-antitoxin system